MQAVSEMGVARYVILWSHLTVCLITLLISASVPVFSACDWLSVLLFKSKVLYVFSLSKQLYLWIIMWLITEG